MKKVIKILCFSLVLLMMFTISACKSKDTGSGNSKESSANGDVEDKLPSEPATISILMGGSNTPAADNIVLKELSKRTNTNINMIYVPSQDVKTKVSTMVASDSLPDIFRIDSANDSIEFKDAGLFAEVGGLLKKHAPNIMKNLGDNLSKAEVNKDGIYLVLNAKLPYARQINLRTDWLKNLGLAMPTDLDSLYKVYYAFTYNDPDKDGKKDTFGLAANNDSLSFASIFGAYGIPAGRNIQLKDGTVTSWVKHPKFLDAMTYIRKLYVEGLFDPDWATISSMDMFGKLWNGVAGAIEWECVGPTNNWMPARYTETPTPTFDFPTIKGPDGLFGVPATDFSYTAGYAFNAKSKNLVSAVKLADYCMSDEGNELLYLGIENTMFKWTDKTNGKYELLGEYKDAATHRAAGGFSYWTFFAPTINAEIRTFNKQTQDGVAKARSMGLPEATIRTQLAASSEYGADLDKIIKEMYAQLIVTKEDPKTVYNKFMADWEKSGGTKWEKEATETYKKENKK
jgi:putative aldouronate transport system substrate-binding protein